MTAALALMTSVLWGLADFGGGLLTRRLPGLTVVVVSQTLAAATLGVIVVVTGAWSEAGQPRLWFAVAAGTIGPAAMLGFYRALALGPMGVVSPLTSLAVVVPLGVGLVLGERPGVPQWAGTVMAVSGVVLAGGPQLRGAPVQRRAVGLSLAAALGFGTVMVLIAEASTTLTGLFLALFVQRVFNVAVGGAALHIRARGGASPLPPKGQWALVSALPVLAFVGLADVAANGTYAIAYRIGPVAVATVLASLYPVVTALVARGVLHERLRAVQSVGACLAVAGTALLAAG